MKEDLLAYLRDKKDYNMSQHGWYCKWYTLCHCKVEGIISGALLTVLAATILWLLGVK